MYSEITEIPTWPDLEKYQYVESKYVPVIYLSKFGQNQFISSEIVTRKCKANSIRTTNNMSLITSRRGTQTLWYRAAVSIQLGYWKADNSRIGTCRLVVLCYTHCVTFSIPCIYEELARHCIWHRNWRSKSISPTHQEQIPHELAVSCQNLWSLIFYKAVKIHPINLIG